LGASESLPVEENVQPFGGEESLPLRYEINKVPICPSRYS
jgi:hypothetical protein